MSARKPATFPLPFARKPAPTGSQSANPEPVIRPVAFLIPPGMFIELMRLRLRHGDRPIGAVPEGAELN